MIPRPSFLQEINKILLLPKPKSKFFPGWYTFNELKGLFWEEEEDENDGEQGVGQEVAFRKLWEFLAGGDEDGGLEFTRSGRFGYSLSKLRVGFGSWRKDEKPKSKPVQEDGGKARRRRKVGLRALERALGVAEKAYLEMTDRVIDCNPELAVMGSCLLVVLVRDEDVHVMNLGNSRAIVAQYREKRTVEEKKFGGDSGEEMDRIGENVDKVKIQVPVEKLCNWRNYNCRPIIVLAFQKMVQTRKSARRKQAGVYTSYLFGSNQKQIKVMLKEEGIKKWV